MGPAQAFVYLGTFLTHGTLVNQNAILVSSKRNQSVRFFGDNKAAIYKVQLMAMNTFRLPCKGWHMVTTCQHICKPEPIYTVPLKHYRLKHFKKRKVNLEEDTMQQIWRHSG